MQPSIHDEPMRHPFTHCICVECMLASAVLVTPHNRAEHGYVRCCWCGRDDAGGSGYVYADPKNVPCGGRPTPTTAAPR